MHRLDIFSIEFKGELDKECIWFDVKEDIASLKFYLVTDTTYTDPSHTSNELRHLFWFPDIAVRKGDYIKLLTKTGSRTSSTNKRRTTTHLLFWGLGHTVWNKAGDCAVLIKAESWKLRRA